MIAIVDYGAGNTKSVTNALEKLNARYRLTNQIAEIQEADSVILPGVGHAQPAMAALAKCGLTEVIKKLEQPLLGICLGMQLLYNHTEEGDTDCLKVIPGSICKFTNPNYPIPAMGWNTVEHDGSSLFENIAQYSYFYLVHSYYAQLDQQTTATSQYGGQYAVAVQSKNFYGVQFHPEKSGAMGRQLLKNFINIKA